MSMKAVKCFKLPCLIMLYHRGRHFVRIDYICNKGQYCDIDML